MSEPTEEQRHTLYIDKSDSECGNCGRRADPSEKQHDTVPAIWEPKEGCHVTWAYVSSHYADFAGMYNGIRAMRPDLEDRLPDWLPKQPVAPRDPLPWEPTDG